MKSGIALLFCLLSTAQTDALPPEAEAVKNYTLQEDYPELFQDKPYRTRIDNLLVVDLDEDGANEVIAHFNPHYRQSPTIVFYRVSKTLEVTRVIEGLAPGALQPISGDYLDSHTLGEAVDMAMGDEQGTPQAHEAFLRVGLENFGGVVAYPNFWHVDSRAGGGAYVDLTRVPNPPKNRTCEDFEFSRVRQIAFGPAKTGTKRYLAAWVGDEIYLYSIAFRADGRLEKAVEVRPVPKGFDGFLPGQGLKYSDGRGRVDTLAR